MVAQESFQSTLNKIDSTAISGSLAKGSILHYHQNHFGFFYFDYNSGYVIICFCVPKLYIIQRR